MIISAIIQTCGASSLNDTIWVFIAFALGTIVLGLIPVIPLLCKRLQPSVRVVISLILLLLLYAIFPPEMMANFIILYLIIAAVYVIVLLWRRRHRGD